MLDTRNPRLDYEPSDLRVVTLDNFQTKDPSLARQIAWARKVASSECSALITGETGTGKSLLARAMHHDSRGGEDPCFAIDFGTMDLDAIDTDLSDVGSSRGSGGRKTVLIEGLFEQPEALISRVLRMSGSSLSSRTSVRLILTCIVEEGKPSPLERLPRPLAYRLPEAHIKMPPLRARAADVPRFLGRYVEEADWRYGCPVEDWRPEVEEMLVSYSWPGNLHELRRVTHGAVLRAKGKTLEVADVEPLLGPTWGRPVELHRRTLREVEDEYVARVLEQERGNMSRAARVLDVHRSTIGVWKKRLSRKA